MIGYGEADFGLLPEMKQRRACHFLILDNAGSLQDPFRRGASRDEMS
jgi:hypothetical protein